MADTKEQFDKVIAICRDLFCKASLKIMHLHGASCVLNRLPTRFYHQGLSHPESRRRDGTADRRRYTSGIYRDCQLWSHRIDPAGKRIRHQTGHHQRRGYQTFMIIYHWIQRTDVCKEPWLQRSVARHADQFLHGFHSDEDKLDQRDENHKERPLFSRRHWWRTIWTWSTTRSLIDQVGIWRMKGSRRKEKNDLSRPRRIL